MSNLIVFDQFKLDVGLKLHNLATDIYKMALVTSTAALVATLADPRWGSGGSTNLSTNEVATGSAYSAGGLTLASVSWTLVLNVPNWSATMALIAKDAAAGFTNARYAVFYNSTDSGKRGVGFLDLVSDRRIDTGPFQVTTTGNVMFTLS